VTDGGSDLLTVAEAARLLAVHPNTVRTWGRSGKLPEIRVGPRQDRRYKHADVLALATPTKKPASGQPLVTAVSNSEHRPSASTSVRRSVVQHMATIEQLTKSHRLWEESLASQFGAAARMADESAAINRFTALQRIVDDSALSKATELFLSLGKHSLADASSALMRIAMPPPSLDELSLFAKMAEQQQIAISETLKASLDAQSIALASNLADRISRFDVPMAAIAQITSQLDPLISEHQRWATLISEAAGAAPARLSSQIVESMIPSQRVVDQLTAMMREPLMPSFAFEHAFLSVRAYESFGSTLLAEALGPGGKLSAVIPGALRVAGSVLSSSVSQLSPSARRNAAVLEQREIEPSYPTVYDQFFMELRQSRNQLETLDPEDLEAELEHVPAIEISRLAYRLVQARHTCNRRALLNGEDPIFKPTVDTELITADLIQNVASDETSFSTFIDRMFKYLYESSGDLKRITPLMGPPDSLMDVKFLRQFYFHDLSHGDAPEVRRKHKRVGEVFTRLVGKPIVTSASEWKTAQLSALRQVVEMLDHLSRLLSDRDSPGPSKGS